MKLETTDAQWVMLQVVLSVEILYSRFAMPELDITIINRKWYTASYLKNKMSDDPSKSFSEKY